MGGRPARQCKWDKDSDKCLEKDEEPEKLPCGELTGPKCSGHCVMAKSGCIDVEGVVCTDLTRRTCTSVEGLECIALGVQCMSANLTCADLTSRRTCDSEDDDLDCEWNRTDSTCIDPSALPAPSSEDERCAAYNGTPGACQKN